MHSGHNILLALTAALHSWQPVIHIIWIYYLHVIWSNVTCIPVRPTQPPAAQCQSLIWQALIGVVLIRSHIVQHDVWNAGWSDSYQRWWWNQRGNCVERQRRNDNCRISRLEQWYSYTTYNWCGASPCGNRLYMCWSFLRDRHVLGFLLGEILLYWG